MYVRMYYLSETGLCTVAPSPTDTPFPFSFWGEGATVHRLSETDNPSSNCSSKLMDKVRRIVHSKGKPFPFQIKTYYLSDANYQTDNPSDTNNPSLVWKHAVAGHSPCKLSLSFLKACTHHAVYLVYLSTSINILF